MTSKYKLHKMNDVLKFTEDRIYAVHQLFKLYEHNWKTNDIPKDLRDQLNNLKDWFDYLMQLTRNARRTVPLACIWCKYNIKSEVDPASDYCKLFDSEAITKKLWGKVCAFCTER